MAPTPTQRLAFALRGRLAGLCSRARLAYWRGQGLRAGPGTRAGRLSVTWPHQVALGRDCLLEDDVTFKYHGPADAPAPAVRLGDDVFVGRGCEFNVLVGVEIGSRTMLAAGCRLVDHDHGLTLGEVRFPGNPREGGASTSARGRGSGLTWWCSAAFGSATARSSRQARWSTARCPRRKSGAACPPGPWASGHPRRVEGMKNLSTLSPA